MAEHERPGRTETLGPRVEPVSGGSAAAAASATPKSSATNAAATPPATGAAPKSVEAHQPKPSLRRVIGGAAGLVALAVALYFGIPYVSRAFNTVSTDDAYVNGHVTFVAARVPGQVVSVLVDDNYRVRKGDVLVRLDPKPYAVIVDSKRAGLRPGQVEPDGHSRQRPRDDRHGAGRAASRWTTRLRTLTTR